MLIMKGRIKEERYWRRRQGLTKKREINKEEKDCRIREIDLKKIDETDKDWQRRRFFRRK